MIVLGSLVIGILIAVAGAFATGLVAAGCVDWYRIPSREGGSGYFVVFLGLGGGIAGFFLGCICGGVMGADSLAGFGKGFGLALAIVLLLNGTAAIICRLLADIPPVVDGEDLFLIAEFRLPADQTAPPALESGDAYVLLGSIPRFSHRVRKTERGPLWANEAELVDSRWILRGAVSVFTRRGKRMLSATLGESVHHGFIVPLPAKPGREFLKWSDWLPRARPDGKPLATDLQYRFRVQRWSEPMRTESVWPFEIDTITRGFFYGSYLGKPCMTGQDTFKLRFRGLPFSIEDKTDDRGQSDSQRDEFILVATVPSEPRTLLVQLRKFSGGTAFFLLREVNDQPVADWVADGEALETFEGAAVDPAPPGGLHARSPNRRELVSGWYRVGYNGLLNTRTLAIHRFTAIPQTYDSSSALPLLMSPDERSFVRTAETMKESSSKTTTVLAVTDFVGDCSYLLPFDRARMHFTRTSELNAAWVEHHFAWTRDENGIDQLAARPDFTVLPYRGEFGPAYAGRHEYRLDLVGEDMRTAIETFLMENYQAVRQLGGTDYEHNFTVDGKTVSVNCGTDFAYVTVGFDAAIDPAVAKAMADRFDAELASGRYDSFFQV